MGEKPYFILPFPGKAVKRGAGAGHYSLNPVPDALSGRLVLKAKVLRPLSVYGGINGPVRAGQREGIGLLQLTCYRNQKGKAVERVVLPGSSFKGLLRTVVESISLSCLGALKPALRNYLDPQLELLRCREGERRVCPACRLFGTQDYAARVQVRDVFLDPAVLAVKSTPPLWAPARGRGLPQVYLANRNRAKGRKFYLHSQVTGAGEYRTAIKEGTGFTLEIYFYGLSRPELGLLAAALGVHPRYRFLLKMGAAKPVGWGAIELSPERLELCGNVAESGRMGAGLREVTGPALEGFLQEAVAGALDGGLIEEASLEKLSRDLAPGTLNSPPVSLPY